MSSTIQWQTFLRNLASKLDSHAPKQLAAKKHASVAAILRIRSQNAAPCKSISIRPGASAKQAVNLILEQPWSNESQLEILYMRRTINPRDPWSGHISFPGGRKEDDESPDQTAIREVFEEIGLILSPEAPALSKKRLEAETTQACTHPRHSKPSLTKGQTHNHDEGATCGEDCEHYLAQAHHHHICTAEGANVLDNHFVCLGALDQRPVGKTLVVSPYVYLQTVPGDVPFRLQESEVSGVRWVNVTSLFPGSALTRTPMYKTIYPASFSPFMKRNISLLKMAGLDELHCASLHITASQSDLSAMAKGEDPPSQEYPLWGLTFLITSDIMFYGGMPAYGFPFFHTNSRLVNLLFSMVTYYHIVARQKPLPSFQEYPRLLFHVSIMLSVLLAILHALIW